MKKLLLLPLLVLALAAAGLVATPKAAEATVFDCVARTYSHSIWNVDVTVCAEHMGDGHYRSYVYALTSSGSSFPTVNYAFNLQRLYYYCGVGQPCTIYDQVTNNFNNVSGTVTSKGTPIGCPGASNNGKVYVADGIDVRFPDNFLGSYFPPSTYPTAFNSAC